MLPTRSPKQTPFKSAVMTRKTPAVHTHVMLQLSCIASGSDYFSRQRNHRMSPHSLLSVPTRRRPFCHLPASRFTCQLQWPVSGVSGGVTQKPCIVPSLPIGHRRSSQLPARATLYRGHEVARGWPVPRAVPREGGTEGRGGEGTGQRQGQGRPTSPDPRPAPQEHMCAERG